MDELITKQPKWRQEPHLYCDFAIMNRYVGQYKTFLAKVESSNPYRLFGGSVIVTAKIDESSVSLEDRLKLVAGRYVQVIAKVHNGFIRIVHVTIMHGANDQSLKFRNRVAQVLHEVFLFVLLRMDTFDLDKISYEHFVLFSSLKNLHLICDLNLHSDLTVQIVRRKIKRFAALLFLTFIPHEKDTEVGPINFSDELKFDEYFFSEFWVPFSMYARMTRFWLTNFLFLKNNILHDSLILDTMAETFLHYDSNCDFFNNCSSYVIQYKENNNPYIKITLTLEENTRLVHRPLIPPLRTRASFDTFSRNEKFWSHDSFYDAHDNLVKKIWQQLEPKERDVYCLGFRKRRGFDFNFSESEETSSDSITDGESATQVIANEYFSLCLDRFLQES